MGHCLHCERPTHGVFCCSGCEHVYNYINKKGLARYYSLRKSIGISSAELSVEHKNIGLGNSENEFVDFAVEPFIWKESKGATTFAAYTPTLSCAACLWLIRSALERIQGVKSVNINFDEKLIFVAVSSPESEAKRAGQQHQLKTILQALINIGFRSYPPNIYARDESRYFKTRKTMMELAVSGAIFANVMLFTAAVYLGRAPGEMAYSRDSSTSWIIEPQFRLFFDVSAAILTTVSLVFVGRRFFLNAWNGIKLRTIHIDQPIALALSLAYILSLRNLLIGSPLLYFDSVSGLIFLLLVARAASELLTDRAKRLAESAIASIPPSAIKVGDQFRVAPGDIVLADGIVTDGMGEISEVALTGETNPVLKRVGDKVWASSQNLVSALTVRATSSAGESYVQRIRQTISQTTNEKPNLPSNLDLILRWFVVGIFLATGLAVLLWWQHGVGRMIEVVCAVLIVSCPCALALAVPLARSFSLKRAWSAGAIIKSPEALGALSQVNTLVLDKTGTLTSGVMSISGLRDDQLDALSPEEYMAIIALAERSRHPVSVGLAKHLRESTKYVGHSSDSLVLSEIIEVPGIGLTGKCKTNDANYILKIGRLSFVDSSGAMDYSSGFSIATGNGDEPNRIKILPFNATDPFRPDAADVIRKWQQNGLEVHILSGDTKKNVSFVAAEVGVESWCAETLPEEKQAYIKRLAERGKIVAMVGDGINDAAAISSAHVGIAVKGGADLALSSADVFLSRDGISVVDQALEFSGYCQTTEKIVIGFGLIYNLIAIALALAGILHPLAAALIMPLSSLSVVTVAYLRKGVTVWKPSISSCPLPSPSPV